MKAQCRYQSIGLDRGYERDNSVQILAGSRQELEFEPEQVVEFVAALLAGVDLQESVLGRLELTDAVFEKCDASNGKWSESALVRARFVDCRLIGIDLGGASIQHVTFERCAIELSSFRLASFKSAVFNECTMRDTEFSGADLRGVRFSQCDLKRVQMSGAKLKGADLRGSSIDDIRVSPADLGGAIVDPIQMTGLAWTIGRHFGIIVRE